MQLPSALLSKYNRTVGGATEFFGNHSKPIQQTLSDLEKPITRDVSMSEENTPGNILTQNPDPLNITGEPGNNQLLSKKDLFPFRFILI